MKKMIFLLILLSNIAMAQKGAERTLSIANVSFTESKDHERWQASRTDVSLADFLEHPALTTSEGHITSFTFGIRTSDGDFQGPFFVKGSELTPEIKRTLKAYQGTKGTVYVEDIRVWVKSQGAERTYVGLLEIKYGSLASTR